MVVNETLQTAKRAQEPGHIVSQSPLIVMIKLLPVSEVAS